VNLAASNGLYLVLLLLSGIVVPLTSLRRSSGGVAVALPPGAMAEGLHRVLGQVSCDRHRLARTWIWALSHRSSRRERFDSTKSFEGPQSRAPARPWGSP